MAAEVNLFDRIRQHLPGMSKSYRKVADYLLQHYQDAAFMPAARVAENAGISESVVVRFAASLGYDGYPEMLKDMQALVKASLAPLDRFTQRPVKLTRDTPMAEVLRAVVALDQENLRAILGDASSSSLDRVLAAILAAKHIYIIGFRGLAHLAGLLGFLLELAGARVTVITAGDVRLFEQLRHVGQGDVVLAIAFARYTRRTVEALELAKGRGAVTVALTDSLLSPSAQVAHYSLHAAVSSYSFFNSYTAAVTLINALVVGWSVRAERRTLASLEALEQVLPQGDFT